MTTENQIAPELQARIDQLPDGSLKNRIIRALTGPGKRTASNAEIFENILQSAAEADATRSRWRVWSNSEVLAFLDFFRQEAPDDYVEFNKQEITNNQIDDDIWWRMGRLADTWNQSLTFTDNVNLLGAARDYLRLREWHPRTLTSQEV